MATVLVTGATGTLGRAVVQKLRERGQQVRVYTRQTRLDIPEDVEICQGDIRDGSGLMEATHEVDTIIHCVSVFEEGFATDRDGTRHLIEAAKANGSPHPIYISIVGIDDSPFPYFQAKVDVEHMIEQSDLPYSILRATQFHQYIVSVLTSFEDAQEATITIPAESRFQPIDPSEVADVLVALAEQGPAGRVPDVGGPEVLSLDALAETYARVSHTQWTIHTHTLPGEYFDAFRSDEKLTPERAVGRVTWEQFLQQQAKERSSTA